MAKRESGDFVKEPSKRRRVLYDVDVVVAGAGLCGTFAAIAAGRCGARTLVVERFGCLGGNIGPAMISGGSLQGEAEPTLPGGLAGIAREFMHRLGEPSAQPTDPFPAASSAASFTAAEMMREAGVELLLSAYASDPIMEGDIVKGLFVECKSGRFAVKARVTIDGTGDADIARRAGAPIIPYLAPDDAYAKFIREPYLRKQYPTYYNDTMLLSLVGGVDIRRYQEFCKQDVALTGEDLEWATPPGQLASHPKPLIPALRQAWLREEYRPHGELEANVRFSVTREFRQYEDGLVPLLVVCAGAIDASDPKQISRLEAFTRTRAFKAVAFYRKHAPGWEKAHLVTSAAFLGMRGGPHIDGEHTLTPEEMFAPTRFDDVLYRNIHESNHGGDPSGFDVPYRAVLPKNVDGLLVCGRGAAYLRRGHDPSGMRARPSMMVFGQCVGTAAAIAALGRVTPKKVDIRKVQATLVADGIVLGDEARLREFGLRGGRG